MDDQKCLEASKLSSLIILAAQLRLSCHLAQRLRNTPVLDDFHGLYSVPTCNKKFSGGGEGFSLVITLQQNTRRAATL